MNKNIEELKKRIEDYDIVSFDIFDTLLLRNVVKPVDIFKVVEKKYEKKYKKKIEFYNLRITAENDARIASNQEDVTLSEIYNQISKKICNQETVNILKNLEIESEKEFLIPNQELKSIYEYAKSMNKKVYIISDMYLEHKIIEDILLLNGYSDYDGLYVSSELKYTKATSSLYKYVRENNQISLEKKWLHIGDNKQSDVINAELQGVEGYYYKRILDREENFNINTLSDSICRAVQVNTKHSSLDSGYWYNFGVNHVFPVYIGFTSWLVKLLKGKDNAYFLARDGYIPYLIYSRIKEHINEELPEGRYIYASRRAYQYPHLLKIDKNQAIGILTSFNLNLDQKITLKEILNNINLDSSKYIYDLKKFNIKDENEPIEYGEKLHNVRKFLCYIWDDIKSQLEKELEIVCEYLQNEKVNDYDVINIVDIGWRGSTQLAIKDILEKDVDGYYFGTTENMYPDIMSNSYGYAFDLGVRYEERSFILDNVMMYELLFSAPHGSLLYFQKDNDGNINPKLSNVEGDKNIYYKIKEFQNAAMDVVDEILPYIDYIDDISKDYALKGFEKFIEERKVKDLKHFSELSNSVGFGNSNDIKKYVNIISEEYYNSNKKQVFNESKYNLWRYSVLIKNKNGELNSIQELDFDKFNKYLNKKRLDIKSIIILLKKAINNPQKAVSKIKSIINYKIKSTIQ